MEKVKIIEGKVIKYPQENINTDLIIPARYLVDTDPQFLKKHCMEDLDCEYHKNKDKLQATILIAGSNFGCGSSREQAPIALKASGIELIIAPSFARIFFRNAINIGLPLFISEDTDKINDGDKISINAKTGDIQDITKGITLKVDPLPIFIQKIVDKGGLVEFLRSGGYDNL